MHDMRQKLLMLVPTRLLSKVYRQILWKSILYLLFKFPIVSFIDLDNWLCLNDSYTNIEVDFLEKSCRID